MKLNRFSKLMAATLLAGTPLFWSACTDTWNEHYDVKEGGMADQPSLLENIASDPTLANFYKVVTRIGGSELLSSPQQLTIWAPKSLSAAQADSIIDVYLKDSVSGLKWEDNRAVTQFLQNHYALYTRTVYPNSQDTVTMRNKKYMELLGTSTETGSMNGREFEEMVLCNNGIIYKIDGMLPFFPNVREFTEQHNEMNRLTAFFKQHDEYDLDEEQSVKGGIVDGKVVYLDSVTNLYNRMIDRYGYIQREDSVYTFIAPTDEVYEKEYDQYSKYFVYNSTVNNRDSLSEVNANMCIVQGRFFNTSKNWRYNLHAKDSLCNTQYRENQQHLPRQNVYYNPESTILDGLEKHECSNGYVYVDNKGVIDPTTTFFGRNDISASSPSLYEVPKDKSNIPTMNVSTRSYEIYDYDTTYVEQEDGTTEMVLSNPVVRKYYYYSYVTAKTASAHTSLEYKIPSTYSNVYYNVYVVCCPPERNVTDKLPLWFQVSQSLQNEKGTWSTGSYFDNPNPLSADNVDNFDVIQKVGSTYTRCFVTDPNKVDTILVAKGISYDYCGYGTDNGVIKYTISSFGPSGQSYREKIYTRTLRLNEIIMIPYATKEEAEAAANDLDAFNDEKLQALKEK